MSTSPFFDLFRAGRVNAIMQALEPLNLIPQSLRFLNRCAVVPATDGEIMARFTGRVQIADIVADDAGAVVYQAGKFTFETTQVPNLKHGAALSQEMLNVIGSIANGQTDPDGIFSNYEARTISSLLLGVQQRMEALIIAMHLDGLDYNRLGIVMNDVTWGTPSDLKVTASPAWTSPTTAKPLSDIRLLQQVARTRYGYNYNRATMSTSAFDLMCATTQFQNEARSLYIGPSDSVTGAVIGAAPQGLLVEIARRLLNGVEIELYDDRYWSQAADGTLTSARFLPIEKVILTNSSDDRNSNAYDFANGEITEFKVAQIAGSGIIGASGNLQSRGPAAYATLANAQLNPPGVNYWAVARGFPRKHLLQSSAYITVGSVSDPVSSSEP